MHNTIHIHPLDKYIVQSLQYYTSASKLLTRKTSLYNSCLCHLAGYIPLNLRSGLYYGKVYFPANNIYWEQVYTYHILLDRNPVFAVAIPTLKKWTYSTDSTHSFIPVPLCQNLKSKVPIVQSLGEVPYFLT